MNHAPPPRDHGITLVEIVIGVVIGTMVMGVIAAALATSLSAGAGVRDVTLSSNDGQLIANFFTRDVQSVGQSGPAPSGGGGAPRPVGVSVSNTSQGWAGCAQAGTLVVRFAWAAQDGTNHTVVTYSRTSLGDLVRRACTDSGATTMTLASGVTTAVGRCNPVADCGPLTSLVELSVSGVTESGSTFSHELSASLRSERSMTPLDGIGAPLALLGRTTCPTLDLQTELYVAGLAAIAEGCGAAPIAGDLDDLRTERTVLASTVSDPLAGLEPPGSVCTSAGAEPTLGASPSADAWVVHRQPVVIDSDVDFDAGRYVFCEGATIEDGASVTGAGVVWLFITSGLRLEADAHLDLSPPTTGPYALVSMWSMSGAHIMLNAGDSVDEMSGIVYAPEAVVYLDVPRGIHLGGIVSRGLAVTGDGAARLGRPLPALTAGSTDLLVRLDEVTAIDAPTIAGGVAPYVWTETMLVPGVWLASDGSISGTASVLGTSVVDAVVRDASGATLVVPLTIEVTAAPSGCPASTTGWWAQYWDTPNRTGPATLCRLEPTLSYDWGTGAPAPGLPSDGFSTRWTRVEQLDAGQYVFTATGDDRISVAVDGGVILDSTGAGGRPTSTATVSLTGGTRRIVVEHADASGRAAAAVSWRRAAATSCPAPGTDWTAEYFAVGSTAGGPAICRNESVAGADWGTGGPTGLGRTDEFAARWTRTRVMVAGTYSFVVRSDERVRLLLDGVPIVDADGFGTATTWTTTRTVAAGPHTLVLEYIERSGAALATLSWAVDAPPGAPGAVTATAGDTTSTVTWTPALSSGEPATTSYTVTATASGVPTRTCTTVATATTCTLTDLINGVTYDIGVVATNSAGSGTPATTSVMPRPAVLTGSNAQLWLDARDPDGDGIAEGASENCDTTVVCSTTNRLIRWRDKSGTARHAVRTTAAQAPRYNGSTAAVDFDANGFYNVTVGVGPDMTNFVVAQSDTAQWNTWGWLAASRGANGWIMHPWVGSTTVGFYPVNSAGIYLAPLEAWLGDITVPRLYDLSLAGSAPINMVAGVDGAMMSSSSAGQIRVAGPVVLRLGADDVGTRLGDGKYREVIVLNRALSSAERRSVQEYLARKWSLTITPSAPLSASAAPGSGSAIVAWNAPTWDGGASITGYRAVASPGGASCTSTAPVRFCTVSGLTDGTSYTFTVEAINARGTGPASAPSPAVIPGPPPGPTGVGATGGDGTATVTWTAPTLAGHAPVASYTVVASAAGQPNVTCSATAPTTTCVLTGLVNGATYTVSVTATSASGTSPAATTTVIPEWSPSMLAPGTLTWWFDGTDPSAFTGAWTAESGFTVSGTVGSTRLTASSGVLERLDVVAGGTGYTSDPTVTLTGGGGSGAGALLPTRSGSSLATVWASPRGSGYTSAPTATVTGGGGSGARVRAYIVTTLSVGSDIRIAGQRYTIVARDGLTVTVNPPLAADATAASVERWRVSNWRNRANPGTFDAVQPTGGSRPSLGTMNGRSALVLGGFQDWLSIMGSARSAGTPPTFDKSGSWVALVAYQPERSVGSGAVHQSGNGFNARVLATAGPTGAEMDYLSTQNIAILNGQDRLDLRAWNGGGTQIITRQASGDTFDWANAGIGTAMVPTANVDWGATGRIGEILFVNAGLDPATLAKAQGYLQRKWGTPDAAPLAPTDVTVVAGDAQATVSWRGANAINATVTSYTVTATATGQTTRTCTTATLTCSLMGLTNGVRYSVTVAATSSAGTGTPSIPTTAIGVPNLVTSANVRLWLDGADANTMTTDTAGVVPAAMGQAVARWTDKSAAANHATQTNVAARPPVGAWNGFVGPVFDGTADGLPLTPTLLPNGTSTSTTFVVAGGNGTTQRAAVSWGGSTNGSLRWVGNLGGSRYVTGSAAAQVWASAWPASSAGLAVAQFSGTGATLWSDSRPPESASGSLNTATSWAGVGQNNGVQLWEGPVFEVIVVDRALDDTERRTIEEYLRRKWGVTVTPGSPTAPDASTTSATSATVRWTAPASDGGSPITSYTAVSSPGGFTCTAASSPCTITGLAAGTVYEFSVRATNAVGVSASSASVLPGMTISMAGVLEQPAAEGVAVGDDVTMSDHVVGSDDRGSAAEPRSPTSTVVVTSTSVAVDESLLTGSPTTTEGIGADIDAPAETVGAPRNGGAANNTRTHDGTNTLIITSANLLGTTLTVSGYLGSPTSQTASEWSAIEIFLAGADTAAPGVGRRSLGSVAPASDGGFTATFAVPAGSITAASLVTAAAEDPAGNTSEFAPIVAVSVPVLEQLEATPSAAYGLRVLENDYTGALVRVRRSSDGAVADIGPAATRQVRTNLAALPANNAGGYTPSGVTATVTGTGTENGLSYVEVRWRGTNTSGAPSWIQWVHSANTSFEPTLHAAVTPGSTITVSAGVRVIAGNQPGVATFRSLGRTTSGGLAESTSRVIAPDIRAGRWAITHGVGATTAYVQPNVFWDVPAGADVDLTVRFYQPNIEVGSGNPTVLATRGVPTVIALPGELDLDALATFVGGADGFVATWYDQSGDGRDLTQSTAAAQPRIVSSGVTETRSGRPAIAFYGTAAAPVSANSLQLATAMTTVGSITSVVQFADDPAATGSLLSGSTSTHDWHSNAPVSLLGAQFASPSVENALAWENGVSVSATAAAWPRTPSVVTLSPAEPSVGTSWSNIGAGSVDGSLNLGSAFSELIVTPGAWSNADRQTVERNQGGYFLIPVA